MIDQSVTIDFPVPPIIKNTMEDVEQAYNESGEYGPFINWVDTLDNVCKECYVTGAITKKQWDTIMSRYPEVDE